jgi:hypothetical protein
LYDDTIRIKNHRRQPMKIYKIFAFIFLTVLSAATAQATLLWESNTNRGTGIFEGLEEAPGTIVLTNDPLFQQGIVYQYNTWDDTNYAKERCESRGTVATNGDFRMSYDNAYYWGWKEMWNPMPINGEWVALHQMHGYGVSGQGAPLVLRCVNGDGNLYMQNGANGVDTNFWHVKFQTNVWENFALHVYLDTNPAVGYCEIWYNGVLQTNNSGTTRWYGPMWDNVDGVWQDSYNLLKWGVYRSGSLNGHGPASTYMTDAKIGTTYADVNPLGGGSFTMTTTPSQQFVAPSGSANYAITNAPLNGFATNITFIASGLPSGATASFNPPGVTNQGTTTMTINTAGSTPFGNYPISIIGSSVLYTNTNVVTFTVSGFTLSVSPSPAPVLAGNSTNLTVTLTTNSYFSGSVSFMLTGLPSGASYSVNPPSLSQSGTTTLTISTTTNTAQGSYPLALVGDAFVSNSFSLIVEGVQANPGTLIWTNGAGNINWSSVLNWTNVTSGGYGPPGISNNVIFTNYSAASASALTSLGSGVVISGNINSSVNASLTVIGLTNYANAPSTSPNYQNIGIASGDTLTVGSMQIGGYQQYDFGVNNTVNTSISGAGAVLMVTNGPLLICQGCNTSGGTHDATLDLSGLDNFTMNGLEIRLGIEDITRSGGILYLAKTNNIFLTGNGYIDTDGSGSPYSGNPALYIGHNKTAPGNGAQLYLGIANSIAADYVTIGRGDAKDALQFNPAFLSYNPSVTISGTNGDLSSVGVYVVGDGSAGEGASTSNTNDFTGGYVNALINYLCVGRGREAANDTTTCSGTMTFNNGTVTANTMAIGFIYPSGSNSFANGTFNVNGTATLAIITNITMATVPSVGGTGYAQGMLNINGGTVDATTITGGSGTSTINLNSGTLEMQPGWATTSGAIQNISTLNVGANGGTTPALLTDVSQISTTNTLTIATNGIVAGNIIMSTPNLLINGTLSPGNQGAGAVTNTGSATFGAGGNYTVNVDDALAGPVNGWGFIQTSGGVNIQATAANPFEIDLQTADNPAANFNSSSNYSWVIATANAGVTNFAANKFTINTSGFQNGLGVGSFFINTNGSSLVLSFTNNLPLPMTMNITPNGSNLIFSGTNGSAGVTYSILASTNLLLPFTSWTAIITNTLDANGNFIFTNPENAGMPQAFYLLKLQ